MQLYRYRNLFGNFNKLDDTTMMICESVYNTTKNIYSNSDYFLQFNESRYRNLYKKWGGLGLFNHKDNDINPLLYGMINYNIEKIDSSLRSAYSVQSSLVINPIEKFGNDKLKNQYLDNLYSGKSIGSFGLTEPNAGSDPSSMITKATLHKDYYIVNGSKTWITNSPIADLFVIWCKDDTNKIIGLVTERTDEINTPEIKDKLSLFASPTGSIYMDNLKIPVSNKLNVSGLKGPFHCLNKARYGISWGVIGAMEDMINTTIQYTDNRKQFSKSLSSFQIIQNDLVKCVELYNNSLNNSFSSLSCIETFEDLEKNIALISYLKRVNCENSLITSRLCRDILGGNGITNSYNIMRHLINLETVNTYEGTKNIHNLIIGRELFNNNAFY
jgi:glutaryl-CoA dehydrogenase